MARSHALIGAIMVLNQNTVDHVQLSHQQQPHQLLMDQLLDPLQIQKNVKLNALMSFINVFHCVLPVTHYVNPIAVGIILIVMLHAKQQQQQKIQR